MRNRNRLELQELYLKKCLEQSQVKALQAGLRLRGRSALKPGERAVCRLLNGQRGRSVQLQLLAVAL